MHGNSSIVSGFKKENAVEIGTIQQTTDINLLIVKVSQHTLEMADLLRQI